MYDDLTDEKHLISKKEIKKGKEILIKTKNIPNLFTTIFW